MNNKQVFERSAGILMPISSLPSNYGIGTLGKEAFDFVDFVVAAKQKYWQVLPLGPTSYGDSPYQSFSAFAGNPYFIDLEILIKEGYLTKKYVEGFDWKDEDTKVAYEKLFNSRFKVLKKAYDNFCKKSDKKAFKAFIKGNEQWLSDYALYMACKEHFSYKAWNEWDDDIRFRKPEALKKYKKMLAEEIEFWMFCQYKFFEQWEKLKAYANSKGIDIIGDIPIYMAYDSADVWANPDVFELNKDLVSDKVAGVPPDDFTELGQKWGNPLYDWKSLEANDFDWWRKRMKAQAELFDVIRIDHFIGIVKYYTIPAKNPDAKKGKYRKGPAKKLIKVINESIGDKKIIAEDLGVEMPEVVGILKSNGYPGMKVLEFAFGGDRSNPHLPYNYTKDLVVYGGTHDNETLMGYFMEHSKKDLKYAYEYLGTDKPDEMVEECFKVLYSSVADVVVFQMQDVLKLDNNARINFPSTLGGNWQWRMKKEEIKKKHVEWLASLVSIYGREC